MKAPESIQLHQNMEIFLENYFFDETQMSMLCLSSNRHELNPMPNQYSTLNGWSWMYGLGTHEHWQTSDDLIWTEKACTTTIRVASNKNLYQFPHVIRNVHTSVQILNIISFNGSKKNGFIQIIYERFRSKLCAHDRVTTTYVSRYRIHTIEWVSSSEPAEQEKENSERVCFRI